MDEKRQSTAYPDLPGEKPTYQTGTTNPPKNHRGFLAIFLTVVIFLCGFSTILSLMRINLLQKLNDQAENRQCQISFVARPSVRRHENPLGLHGHALSDFWQAYYHLPAGLFITYADTGYGLHTGDIIVHVNNQPVTDWNRLLAMLESCEAEETMRFTIYRDGKQLTLEIER